MTAPLAGILVADFSRVLAGPLATQTLADLGARVIKVERPVTGDDTRTWGPPFTESSSSYFECVNRSKESLVLDLRAANDQAVARRLVERADVLVENFLPGTMDRFGLGPDTVQALNPRLIYCSVTGFGSEKGAKTPGYDFVVQAVGGLMSITGEPGGDPLKAGVALVDVLTGKDATIGILAALADRERTGLGQRIEVNLLSSLLGALVNQAAAQLTTGRSPGRMGNQHPSIAPYETLRCADGLLAVACGNDDQFVRLSTALDRSDLACDPRFSTNPSRVAHRTELIAVLESALAAHDVTWWSRAFAQAGIAAGAVGDIGAALSLAADLGLEPTVTVGAGHPDQVRHPITWSRSRPRTPSPPPGLGEHTSSIRDELEDRR